MAPDSLIQRDRKSQPRHQIAGACSPDIIGLRLGMARDTALNFVRCHSPQAELEFDDDWLKLELHGQELGTQVFTATQGTRTCAEFDSQCASRSRSLNRPEWSEISELIRVAAPGLPGKETVMGIWRTQGFKPGDAPTVEAATAALIKKYGEPQKRVTNGSNLYIYWQQDAKGAPVTERSTDQCTGISPRPNESQSWSDACGLTILAEIEAAEDNDALVGALHVGMVDQHKLYAYGEAMQKELDDADAQRRAKETEQAERKGTNLGL
jgi:hypothetical protein